MADSTNSAAAPKPMTAKEAAALVRRTVPVIGKDGKPTGETKERAIREDEVFAFGDHGDHVVVVTVDGQKFIGRK